MDPNQRLLGIALVLALVGCGGTNSSGTGDDTGTGGDDASLDGTSGDDGSTGDTGDDGGFLIDSAQPTDGCTPQTCATLGAECGQQSDGCGGMLNCGTCTSPDTCGGGGFANRCGSPPPCPAKTCADLGATCGKQGDGCGNIIDCGSCATGAQCQGTPSACVSVDAGTCVKKTCADLSATCGFQSDGCGGTLDCGTCTAPQTCGGGGTPNQCGGGCTPKTCASLGVNCGKQGDGCGGIIDCGTCPSGEACGIVKPSVCSPIPTGDAGATCTNLCLQVPVCDGGTTTTITGTVYAPNGVDPIYNATVYIPNGTVQPFTTGLTCDTCGAAVSGSPLVSALTSYDGTFTLKNVPAGSNIPIVIQLGRWRRQLVLPSVSPCTGNNAGALKGADGKPLLRFPKNKSEGDIPKMALVTGYIDQLECTLRKIGIDDAEFTGNSGTGRVNLYRSNGAYLSDPSAPTGYDTVGTLLNDATLLQSYDLAFLACEGAAWDTFKTTTEKTNLVNYTGLGGRVLATHYNYDYLYSFPPFSTTAPWNVDQLPPTGGSGGVQNPLLGKIDVTYAKQQAFSKWLDVVGASVSAGSNSIYINNSRHDVDDAPTPVTVPPGAWPASYNSTRWIYSDPNAAYSAPNGTIQHFTFNTPVGAPVANQCGRVVFSDFHVENAPGYACTQDSDCTNAKPKGLGLPAGTKCLCYDPSNNLTSCSTFNNVTKICAQPFPSECSTTMSKQEHVLEFMIFDLASCIQNDTQPPPPPPTCTPTTCAAAGAQCGQIGDGCGGILDCGTCPVGKTCGGGGVPNVCGGCTPTTCAALGANCGQQGDGCGGILDCGTCVAPQTCGGGGTPNQCGTPPTCVPGTTCPSGDNCGYVSDGCGGVISCGTCPAGQTCGAQTPNVCGSGTCTPITCAKVGANCGTISDGCGSTIDCGTCVAPQTCGGAGTPNVCGSVQ